MRAMVPLLLISLTLAAGDEDWLADTAKRFASPHPEERAAASAAIHRRLATELRPLLDAMRSEDPEVARRARKALMSLVPAEAPKPEQPEVDARRVFGGALVQGQQIRLVINNRAGNVVVVKPVQQNNALKNLGLEEARPVTDPLLRQQLRLAAGRGFAVTKVSPGSRAAGFGLQNNDILVAVNGKRVHTTEEAETALGKMEAKDLRIRILRKGKQQILKRP